MRTLDDVVEHTHDDDAEEQPAQGSESDAPPRTTPVQVPENSDEVSEPTSEFVMPDIVTAQPSGEVPRVVEAESATATTSSPAFLEFAARWCYGGLVVDHDATGVAGTPPY